MNENNFQNDFVNEGAINLKDSSQTFRSTETFAIAVLDNTLQLIYTNNLFLNLCPAAKQYPILNIESDPELNSVLHSFTKSNITEFNFGFTLLEEGSDYGNEFIVEAKKINLHSQDYLLLIIMSEDPQNRLESKVNTLHSAVEQGNLPLMIISSDGKISYTTKSLENILRRTIEDFYGMFFTEALNLLLTSTELQAAESAFRRKEEWTKVVHSFDDFNNISFREFKLNPIKNNTSENTQFLLTATDVTQYLLRNEAIKESERKLKSIVNNISDILFIIREERNEYFFEIVNKNFLHIFNGGQEELTGKNIKSILKISFVEILLDAIYRLEISAEKKLEIEFNCSTKYYAGIISLLENTNAAEKFYIISLKDISSQREYEKHLETAYSKELHLNKLKSTFIENMSHEIRTPLTAIKGYSEIIQDYIQEKDYESINELLISVKDVMNRVVNLFGNIVDLSMIEAGDYKVDLVILNCNQVLRSVYSLYFEKAKQKNISIELKLSDKELLIEIDWIILEKIVNALVNNAIKYSNFGKIILSSYSNNGKVFISITDTGVGISKEDIPILLEPFNQEETGYTKRYEGAGLGLSIAYKLTKLLKGSFEIISEKNSGTNILISFPEKKPEEILSN